MYQPIVAMRSLPGQRYEATLRLRASDGEYIPPFDFLPVARDRGLLEAIDRWVLEAALERLRVERGSRSSLRFFVHQSLDSARSPDWIPWVRD